MNIWGLIIILASILVSTVAFIWIAVRLHDGGHKTRKNSKHVSPEDAYAESAKAQVEHIFDEKFREELRNRGRLHFEKIIGENAMFLQQDLRLTTSELNDYMKKEITHKLQEEFAKYEESIMDAKNMAIDSLTKTQEAIEQQRLQMSTQLLQEVAEERTRLIKRFEENMAEIVNHYVLAAIGDKIDLSDQMNYILSDLEANKKAIVQDMTDGA